MKYAWIAEQGKSFVLSEICEALDVSVSGYRAWTRGGTPDRKRLTDSQMLALIRAIHAELKNAYGSPRMAGMVQWGSNVQQLGRGGSKLTLDGGTGMSRCRACSR